MKTVKRSIEMVEEFKYLGEKRNKSKFYAGRNLRPD
jgi:hypothetical protein